MKLRTLILFAGVLLSTPGMAATDLDRIVAVINDDVIMRSELAEKIRTVTRPDAGTEHSAAATGLSWKNRCWTG